MSKPFLRLVAEDIKERFGNDINNIAIVFNNKRPITYLKKHLVAVYQQAIWSPQFFTTQEFFSQSSRRSQASALTQFFYLYQLHNELLAQQGQQQETLEEFYPIAEIILSDFSQLDYDLVAIEKIYMALSESTEIDLAFQHFSIEQQEFIQQFWQSFSIKGHTAVQQRFLQLWHRLPHLYKSFKAKLKLENQTNYPTIYRALAQGEAEDQHFYKRYDKILFVGFNVLNKAEAQLFKQWQDQGNALFYFDIDRHYIDDPIQEAGLFLRRNLHQTGLRNALGDPQNEISKRSSPIHLYQALGKISEVKLLHDILKENETNEQTSAVLLADESLLVPLLQSLPELKTNITTGYPLVQSPLYGILILWMEVHQLISQQKKTKIPYHLLETFLSHPMTGVDKSQQQFIQNQAAQQQLFEIDIAKIIIDTSVLPDFFVPLTQALQVIPKLSAILQNLLQTMATQERIKQIDSNLLIETRKVLNQLQMGFEKLGHLSIGFQIGLIKKAIAPINSAIEGDPLQGLQIMGLLESRCLNFDNIYILGANEGVLPKTSNTPTFIPDSLRKAFGLPVLANQDALSAYLFYRHFQFSKGIHLLYNGIVDQHSTGEESRFIKQLQFETNFNIIKQTQQQPILFPKQTEELLIEKTGAIWDKLYQDYLVKGRKISASALTCYLQSPMQFFLKYVADIKEPPAIAQEFEMNKLGIIIHGSMEKLLAPLKQADDFQPTSILTPKIALIEQTVLQEISALFLSTYLSLADLTSLQRIMHKIACEYVKMYLQYDIENYKAIRIIELENDRDYSVSFPITVQGEVKTVNLFGIIDRVDEVITKQGVRKMRIVDYKTGSDSVTFTDLNQVFAAQTTNKALLQTLFYTYVYEQVKGITSIEPHLYVARKMREDGTLFKHRSKPIILQDEMLMEQKEVFVDFLKNTLAEIFNPEIPFKHDPKATVYPSDPYTLFYQNSKEIDSEQAE